MACIADVRHFLRVIALLLLRDMLREGGEGGEGGGTRRENHDLSDNRKGAQITQLVFGSFYFKNPEPHPLENSKNHKVGAAQVLCDFSILCFAVFQAQ